jgi:hypothetical protein
MSSQAELFERAATCERAIGGIGDPSRQLALRLLRDLWIAAANESPSMTDAQVAREIASIEKIQARIRIPGFATGEREP